MIKTVSYSKDLYKTENKEEIKSKYAPITAFSFQKSDSRAFSAVTKISTVHNKLLEKETSMIGNNILKINKENIINFSLFLKRVIPQMEF
mgnify:CR=1 FL=1